MKNKIGIVLSGGGVRGIAHIGLLKALEEHGIYPTELSGASAGALTAALYAAGNKPEDMLSFFRTTPLFRFSFYSASKPGLLDSDKYRCFFEKYFPEDRFEALQKKVHVVATDLLNARYETFSSGELIRPLLASAALPPLFTPIQLNGTLYSDGGIMNNFPVEPLLGNCDVIIGSYCNPPMKTDKLRMTSTTNLMKRAAELRFYTDARQKFGSCNYIYEPIELSRFNFLDTKNIDAIFELSYHSALSQVEKIMGIVEGRAEAFEECMAGLPTRKAFTGLPTMM